MKINQECWTLLINLTNNYTSFKIEKGKYLGKMKNKAVKEFNRLVEYTDDEVNYLSKDDIFPTEKKAMQHLIKILKDKYGRPSLDS